MPKIIKIEKEQCNSIWEVQYILKKIKVSQETAIYITIIFAANKVNDHSFLALNNSSNTQCNLSILQVKMVQISKTL